MDIEQINEEEVDKIFVSIKELVVNNPGDFEVLNKKKDRFTYRRKGENGEYIIDCNLGRKPIAGYLTRGTYELVFETASEGKMLGAYGANIWKRIK